MDRIRRLERADVWVRIDGQRVPARVGELLAVPLVEALGWGKIFCGMGVCASCLVTVDGRPAVRACLELVRPGMRVETG